MLAKKRAGRCSVINTLLPGNSTRLSEQNAIAAMEAIQAQAEAKSIQPTLIGEETLNDAGDPEATFTASNANSSAPAKTIIKKVIKGKKPKLTAKEKKERAVRDSSVVCVSQLIFCKMELERIITFLPLEFRGSDPVR
jgi:DASH complex subunit DAM1